MSIFLQQAEQTLLCFLGTTCRPSWVKTSLYVERLTSATSPSSCNRSSSSFFSSSSRRKAKNSKVCWTWNFSIRYWIWTLISLADSLRGIVLPLNRSWIRLHFFPLIIALILVSMTKIEAPGSNWALILVSIVKCFCGLKNRIILNLISVALVEGIDFPQNEVTIFGFHHVRDLISWHESTVQSNWMLASSAVFRRQQFLIRSLGGFGDCAHQNRRQQIKAMSGTSVEADAENIIRAITPSLDPNRYKGQAGKLKMYPVVLWLFFYFPSAQMVGKYSSIFFVMNQFARTL